MQTIDSAKQVDFFKRKGGIVAIYLVRAYNEEDLKAVLNARGAFDVHVRDRWHLLIPCRADSEKELISDEILDHFRGRINPRFYNHDLCDEIVQLFRIKESDLPCFYFVWPESPGIPFRLRDGERDEVILKELASAINVAHRASGGDERRFQKLAFDAVSDRNWKRSAIRATEHFSLDRLKDLFKGSDNIG